MPWQTFTPTRRPTRLCDGCGRRLGGGYRVFPNYHPACEPTTCTCPTPRPDGIGECAGCRRLVTP